MKTVFLMKEKQQNAIKTIAWVAFVGYLLFLTFRAVNFNYQTNAKINSLNDEITLLESEQEYMQALNIYYNTDAYKELEARRKLGLKQPGETVIKIPIDPEKLSKIENREVIQRPQAESEGSQGNNNPRKWLRFVLRI